MPIAAAGVKFVVDEGASPRVGYFTDAASGERITPKVPTQAMALTLLTVEIRMERILAPTLFLRLPLFNQVTNSSLPL